MWVLILLILMNSSRGFLEFSSYLRLKSKTAGMPIKWQRRPIFNHSHIRYSEYFRIFPSHQLAATQNLVCTLNNVYTYHRVSKGPKRVLGFGRRQKLSFRSHFFFISSHLPHHPRIRLNKLHTQNKFKFTFTFCSKFHVFGKFDTRFGH